MIKSKKAQKSVFWEALILTIFIFASGILVGYILEQNRVSKILTLYQESELNTLDLKIRENILSLGGIDCPSFLNETLKFADKIYGEAVLLDKYESASKLSEGIMIQHKKYDLLRAMLWTDTINFKAKCGGTFDTLIYFYEYKSDSMEIKSTQQVFSNKLSELKVKKGNNIILIPMAGNMNIGSIDYLKKEYNITSLPAILVNEKQKIDSIEGLNTLENYLK